MSPIRLRPVIALLPLLAFTACKSKQSIDTGIIVEVTSDLYVPNELNRVQVIATDPQEKELYNHTFDLIGSRLVWLPFRAGLYPLHGTGTPVHIKAVGLFYETEVVSRSATLSFSPGKQVVLPLPLMAVCSAVKCTEAYSTCKSNGQCADDHEDVGTLPPYESDRPIPGQDAGATRPDADAPDAPLDGSNVDTRLTSDSPFDGRAATGGSSGTTATGGSASATGGSAGDSVPPAGGTGGTSSWGGTSPSGGTSALGGTGGNVPIAGTTSSAGKTSSGGTGGVLSSMGGNVTTGGTVGSSTVTGGTTSGTGGTGGGVTSGGTTAGAGGTSATGGASTGGFSAGSTVSNEAVVYISTNGSCVSGSGTTWTPGTISASTGTATVTVNDSTQRQTWEGFGGTFNELGWKYMQMLGESDKGRIMQLLFGTDGAHFTMGRIPMGANDYAVNRYTCNESSEDLAMEKFSIERDNTNLIPYIKAALAVNPGIKFWASPWTPPTWMKTGPFTAITDDGATTRSNFDSGNMMDDASTLDAYAQYFVKFIAAYKAANINISMVAPQNDPGYAQHYPSCLWTPSVYTTFVGKHLGPALQDTGVGIMLGGLANVESGKDLDLASAALADSTAKSFFKVAGVAWGALDKVNSGTSLGNLPVWVSQHRCGNYPWNPSGYPAYNSSQAPNDQEYGVESWVDIRDAINKGKVTAYHAWNMVLDTVGNGIDTHRAWNQNALLAIDTSAKAVKVTPAYCVFRHFSQFVDMGAKALASSGEVVSFKNPDESLVAVVYSAVAKDKFVVSIGGKKFEFSMPAGGWATVKFKP